MVLEDGTVRQVHKSRKLAKATGPYQTKRAAEGLAEKTLRPLNDGVLVPESTMTLNRFIETVYLPYAERQKRRSTFIGYRNMWKRYRKPDGDKALREFRAFECAQMLLSIARTHDLCRSTLAHIKHFLGGAFRHARRQGVLDSPNPVREVEIPRTTSHKMSLLGQPTRPMGNMLSSGFVVGTFLHFSVRRQRNPLSNAVR